MNENLKAIIDGENIRENINKLKDACGDLPFARAFLSENKDLSAIKNVISGEDAKARKNAALLLGKLAYAAGMTDKAAERELSKLLFDAYKSENTRFVKSSYLKALEGLKIDEFIPVLKQRYDELLSYTPSEEEVKHIDEEKKLLIKLLSDAGELSSHGFKNYDAKSNLVITTLPAFRSTVSEELSEKGIKTASHPLGVLCEDASPTELLKYRFFKELLFAVGSGKVKENAKECAAYLAENGVLELLSTYLDGKAPYYFRVSILGLDNKDDKTKFIKALSKELEAASKGALINSSNAYEAELRLVPSKDGDFYPVIALKAMSDHRFDYRKQVLSTSMHPSVAAAAVKLASAYFDDNPQKVILDAACGSGTLLIERCKFEKPYDCYGVDIFGDAITGAKENAENAGLKINFIKRNFKDFTSKHLFDEIWAEMPAGVKKSESETAELYKDYFDGFDKLLNEDGKIFLISSDAAAAKKELKKHPDRKLLKDYSIRKKTNTHLFVIG
ncbi:MAG: methyltransferase domain-containing protein [Lachnospiraceae bacterium]|nr:methyltransferase domain-containing protein [Lachnospiraceae bacterium]